MENTLPKKWIKRAIRLALWLGAAALSLLILIQLVLATGIFWIQSGSGQSWVKDKLAAATAGSGYEITLEGLHYRLPTGIEADTLNVTDEKGLLFEAHNVQTYFEIFPLPARTLLLALSADDATLYRLPEKSEDAREDDTDRDLMKPFALPDLYFKTLALSKASIGSLMIKAPVAGQDVSLAPRLSGRLHIGASDIAGKLLLDTGDSEIKNEAVTALLPRTIAWVGRLDTQAVKMDIDRLRLDAAAYTLEGKGSLALDHAGSADLAFSLSSETLRTISPDLAGSLSIRTTLSGPLDRLDSQSSAVLSLDALREKGFSPLDIALDVKDLPAAPQGDIALTGTQNDAPVSLNARFALKDNILHLEQITAKTPDLAFTGDASAGEDQLDLRLDTLSFGNFSLQDTTAALSRDENDALRIAVQSAGNLDHPFNLSARATLAPAGLENLTGQFRAGKGILDIAGSANAEMIDITANTSGFPLKDFPLALPEPFPSLILDGQGHLGGPPDTPQAKATLSLQDKRIALTASGVYKDNRITLDFKGTGPGIRELTGHAAAPARFSLSPFALDLDEKTPLEGAFSGNLDAADIADIFLPPEQTFSGKIKTSGRIAGSLYRPDITAILSMDGGLYRHENLGAELKDIALRARIENRAATLESFTATDGENGTLKASGTIDLNAPAYETALKLTAANLHALRSEQVNSVLDADLILKGHHHAYTLSGDITAQQLDVILPERFSQSIPALTITTDGEEEKTPGPSGNNIALDVAISAPKKVFVRGWGLDAEFGGKIKMTGTLDAPDFEGQFSSLRGRYDEFGKRFTITKAALVFSGPVPPSPSLDITTETKAEDITAQVNINGTALQPKISFSSAPALPQDEILSRILFGRDMSKVSPFQAVELTRTLQRFSGNGGGFYPLGALRSGTGLDDIHVDTDDSGEASVGAGKYLSDNVYLDVESGSGETGGSATVEIELTPHITVESEIGQDAQAGAGILWKWDY